VSETCIGTPSFNSDIGAFDRSIKLNVYQDTNSCERRIASANSSAVKIITSQGFITIHDTVRALALPHTGFIVLFLVVHCVLLFPVVVLHLVTFLYQSVKASSPKLFNQHFNCWSIFLNHRYEAVSINQVE
jgi:hypothetical protein